MSETYEFVAGIGRTFERWLRSKSSDYARQAESLIGDLDVALLVSAARNPCDVRKPIFSISQIIGIRLWFRGDSSRISARR